MTVIYGREQETEWFVLLLEAWSGLRVRVKDFEIDSDEDEDDETDTTSKGPDREEARD